MNYKVSSFNIFLDTHHVVFNCISKSMAILEPEIYGMLQYRQLRDIDALEPTIKNGLVSEGFILDARANEYDALKQQYRMAKYGKDSATLIIAPTLGCNFYCPYCFEAGKRVHSMTAEAIERLKKYLSNKIAQFKGIQIRWIGGEPLMAWKEIADISKFIIDRCNKTNTNYGASMATNGYLLTEEILTEMRLCKINKLQITLDGPPEIHDKRRYLSNGQGTFHAIMENVKLATRFLEVIVRVNIDKENKESLPDIFKILNDNLSEIEKSKIKLFCRPTFSCGHNSSVYKDTEFWHIESELVDIAKKYQLSYAFHPNLGCSYRCPSYHWDSFCIGPNCELYKCVEEFGDVSRSVGFINENGNSNITDPEKYYRFLHSYDPFEIDECKQCPILPLCFGKCALVWETGGKRISEGCIPEKFTIKQKLTRLVEDPQELDKFRNQLGLES